MQLTYNNLITRKSVVLCFVLLSIFACSNDDDSTTNTGNDNSNDIPQYDESSQYVGLNFNEQLQFIDFPQIDATETTWVRGFVDFFQFYEAPSSLATDGRILNFKRLHPNGYQSILSLKFLFRGKNYPAVGSDEMNDYMEFLDTLLDEVWDSTTIIIVGNEPFIETDNEDYGPEMYNFYITACERVKAYADAHTAKPIYFGSFDNMYQENRRTLPVLLDLLEYAKNTSWISGVDMHIHHSEMSEMESAMDFVNARIREDQKIMVSEYSLMKHWRANLHTILAESFTAEYGYPENMQVYQYIDQALKNPTTIEQWTAFLSSSPWFENRKHYLMESYEDVFSSYDKFFIATYAFRQSYPMNVDFTGTTDPWVLNGIYANRSVEPDNFGNFQFNYAFIDDFKLIQEESNGDF